MHRSILVLFAASLAAQSAYSAAIQLDPDQPYRNPRAPVEIRVADLLNRMSLEEKIDLLHGNDMETHPNTRLGIPSLKMTDGPLGVRWEHATSFPAAILWASGFDPGMVERLTGALASETLAKGRDMLLGPCVNISRAPQGGRNFESFGEDPYLTSRMAETYVTGLQSHGVMASTKHFAVNDQETERTTIDVQVDERTLQEIHLPAFVAAVRAGTWSVMAAYNRVNGHHATENDWLLNTTLKGQMGFQGFVISDWTSTHDTVAAANHGLDLEMPQGDFFGHGQLEKAVHEGRVTEAVVTDKARRILRAMFAMGVFDRKASDRPDPSTVNSPEHRRIALELAQSGLVLLKNADQTLPLRKNFSDDRIHRYAVIGPNAAHAREGGGGSSKVEPFHAVSPLEGLQGRLRGSAVELPYAEGAHLESLQDEAVRLAAASDAALVFVGLSDGHEGEGGDRKSMALPENQNRLIEAVAAVNPRTVVVINTGGSVLMPWLPRVSAVVQAWYPGEEGGNAIADLILGNINPSGKLPVTFYRQEQDASSFGSYPGRDGVVRYSEGIFVGYRHVDRAGIAPLFPFGHGLSYTRFKLSNLRQTVISGSANHPDIEVSVDVTNAGAREGSEVAQLYIHDSAPILPRPEQELKGFQKIALEPGETKSVRFKLEKQAFAFYNPESHAWEVKPGEFEIRVGTSSRDIRAISRLTLNQ